MRLWLPLAATALLLAAIPARAEDPAPDCKDPQTQADMNICAGNDADSADQALNAQYKLTRKAAAGWDAGLEADARGAEKALVAAQRAWIAYRDAECTLEGFSTGGGSMQPTVISNCLERVTKARTEELKSIQNDYGQ